MTNVAAAVVVVPTMQRCVLGWVKGTEKGSVERRSMRYSGNSTGTQGSGSGWFENRYDRSVKESLSPVTDFNEPGYRVPVHRTSSNSYPVVTIHPTFRNDFENHHSLPF